MIVAMSRADLSSPRTTRLGVAVLVAALHVLVVLALIRAFAPQFTAEAVERVTSVFTVEISPPEPKAPPEPRKEPEPAGAAGEAGRKAEPKEAAAVPPRIVVAKPKPAPPVAGQGKADSAGARDAGAGTGAGGQGSGTGAGGSGTGQGGGGAKAVKTAGDINSARDYPKKTRELRLGDHVVVALTVGSDGRVRGCRVHRPSRDAEADRITCRLATDRFRFRPATDAQGRPVESIYGWQQRWYPAGEKD